LELNLANGIGTTLKYLMPELNENGLNFKDLAIQKTKIQKRKVNLNILFSLKKITNVPRSDLEVIGKQVRMTLYNKNMITSNIYSIPAHEMHDEWIFNSKMGGKLFSKPIEANPLFLRTFERNQTDSILFELSLLVQTKEGPIKEISCGWTNLPLYTLNGDIIQSKTHELQIFGGSPFDKDVSLLQNSRKQSLFSKPKPFPTLIIKIQTPSTSMLEKLKY
jgi:hypothetical protein